jgi:hypothetical protein
MSIYLTTTGINSHPSSVALATAMLGVSSHRGFFKHLPSAIFRSSIWEAKSAISIVPKVDGSHIRVNGSCIRDSADKYLSGVNWSMIV